MKSVPVPLHYQICSDLRKKLQNGEWNIGDIVPGDKELMRIYNVSSTTVRRALDELVREGWLERKPGKGTFVKKQHVEILGQLTGFFDEIRAKGYEPSSKILRTAEVNVEEFDDLELDVIDSEKVFAIEKIHLMDNNPIVLVKSFWPLEIGRKFQNYDLVNHGTYEIAQRKLGIVLEEAHQDIYSTLAGPEEAEHLGIDVGAPLLAMKRLVFSQGKPLELSINYYHADRYRYRVILKNEKIEVGNGFVVEKNRR